MTMTTHASADGTYGEFQVGGVPKMRLGADTSGQPFSFRNLLINGNFNINQRAYVSGTNTVSSNQYTLDRWRIPVSGFNFTFAASGNGNLLTLPSGMSIEQVVEGANVVGGTYVINWEGTASCEIDGVPKTKGATVTLTANTNVTVEFINGTLGKAQLAAGSIDTSFENRPISVELAMCQRYYEHSYSAGVAPAAASYLGCGRTVSVGTGASTACIQVRFAVPKRIVPTFVSYSPLNGAVGQILDSRTTNRNASYGDIGTTGCSITNAVTTTAAATHEAHWTASAEF